MGQFDDKVVSLWVITFDLDISRTYVYTSFDKMKMAIGSHLLMTLPDFNDGEVQNVVDTILEKLDGVVFSPIIINEDSLVIRRIDLDRHNQVHKVLSDCYDLLNEVSSRTLFDQDGLREQIASLFV